MIGSSQPGRLDGLKILVVEDEFYLAMDLSEGLQRAGGNVIGPCGNAETCFAALLQEKPDCALVDINLGDGPSFELAEELKRRHVPFLFLTGYDAPAVPPEHADVERIEKPADTALIVAAVCRLTANAA